MKPKEKADQLVKEFMYGWLNLKPTIAIQCALKVVDEVWGALHLEHAVGDLHNYWSNVKFEIENML